ncbi:PQQ-binding-like beta-propeller repeat protein [Haloarcula litorea]|uniref:outer membrane protein assembly factor BamB family protein n=1 Tax=Haloarcula litorea TaxID=3032579 RepID=UPI0023E80B82|nr:PQQ-binding-like beta-propeller repeat protein [Halomicroarcula sp. GDY20]
MSDAPRRGLVALTLAVLTVTAVPVGVFAPIGIGAAGNAGNTAGNTVDWTGFQADQRNSGNAPAAPDYSSVSKAGNTPASQGTDIASGPTVGGDAVFVGDGSTVKSYARSDRSTDWETSVDGAVLGSPAYVDGSVYVATDAGTVYGIDADTGTVNWHLSKNSDDEAFAAFHGSVTADGDGSLYVASDDGMVYKIASDGSQVSTAYDMGSPAGSMTPAVYDNRVYVGDRSGTLHMLSSGDLSAQSTVDVAGGALSSPAVTEDGQRIVVAATDGTVAAYDTDGNEQWRDTATYEEVWSSPVLHAGTVVVGGSDGVVAAHDLDGGGSVVWETEVDTKETLGAALSAANGTVFVGTDSGTLAVLDADDGSSKFTATVADSPLLTAPTVAYDSLYVGTSDGELYEYVDADAAFSVTALDAPGSVTEGDTATIAATVSNSGDADGTYTATLLVDGETSDQKQVSVSADSSKEVTFQYSFDTTGERSVSVGSLSKTVTVDAESTQGSGGGGGGDDTPDPTATPENETATPDNTTATPENGTATPDNTTATPTQTDVPETETETAEPDTATETDADTATGTDADTATETEAADDGGDDDADGGSGEQATSGSGPGFTAVVALVALVAAALLAVRRDE